MVITVEHLFRYDAHGQTKQHGSATTSPVWFVVKIKFIGSDVQCAMVQTTSRNTARFTMLLIFFGYVSQCTIPDLVAGCPIQAS